MKTSLFNKEGCSNVEPEHSPGAETELKDKEMEEIERYKEALNIAVDVLQGYSLFGLRGAAQALTTIEALQKGAGLPKIS